MTDDIINLDEVMAEHEFVINGEQVWLKQFDGHPVADGGVLVYLPEPYTGITFTQIPLRENPEQTSEEKLQSALWRAKFLAEEADALVAARAHLRSAIVGPVSPDTHPLYAAITARIAEIRQQMLEIEI